VKAGPSTRRVERFRADLERLTKTEPARVGVAVSGGADSLALLLLAEAALPGRVEAATVDHGLRTGSDAEARFVAGLCAGLGIPHATLRPAEPIRGSLQAAARRARYALLEQWREERGLEAVLTGHHADDQAETLLMRLNRGAGLGGQSGIRPRFGRVLRPLLGWRHAELAELVAEAGIEAVLDPANRDERFDRARIRRRLAGAPWLDPVALARSAGALAESDEALEWAAERLAGERISGGTDGLRLDVRDLPPELRRRLVLRVLRRMGSGGDPRGESVSRLLDALQSGGTATLAGVRCSGGAPWRFEPAPRRRQR